MSQRERFVPINELPGSNADPKELNTYVCHLRFQQDQITGGQGYNWSSPPGELPDAGIEPRPSALQTDPLPSRPPGKPKAYHSSTLKNKKLKPSSKKCLRDTSSEVEGCEVRGLTSLFK